MPLKFTKLTRPNVRKLQPGQQINEHGIVAECLASGDVRYSVNVMIDGERVHRVVGRESDGVTREQCEEFIAQSRTDARKGRLNLPKGRKLHLSFKEAQAQYMARLEASNGKDLKSKTHRLRDHLTPFFGAKILSKITTFEVERYKKHRLGKGAAPGTINRELLTLSHLLNMAIEWKWIYRRPCTIKQLKEPPSRFLYLTVKESNTLLEKAKQDDCPGIYLFVFIALRTCMRRSEILGIRVQDIDLGRKLIYIPKAKAGAREQPITPELAQALGEHIAKLPPEQTWLFPAENSKTGHWVAPEKPFRRVVEAAGLDVQTVNRHTLRHTAITHLVQAGVDLVTVQRVSGHHSLDMIARYAHANGEHIQTAMATLDTRYQWTDPQEEEETELEEQEAS